MIYFVLKNNILFYETFAGNCPVANFLKNLPPKHHAKAVRNLELLEEFGQFLQGGLIAHVYKEIWELRISSANNISRILYFMPTANTFILLCGFIKKTPKTPQKYIKIAQKRMNDYNKRLYREGE